MILESLLLTASLSVPISEGMHPRTVAEEFCADKGGLLMYIDRGSVIEFRCFDEPSRVITIKGKG